MAQELIFGQQTNIYQCTMDFYKKVAVLKVRGPDFHPKPLSIILKLGVCIDIWTSCFATTAASGTRVVFGQQTNIHRYTMNFYKFYKTVAILEVRSSSSPTKPLFNPKNLAYVLIYGLVALQPQWLAGTRVGFRVTDKYKST